MHTLDVVSPALQGVQKLSDNAPLEGGARASGPTAFAGIAAFAVRNAYLTLFYCVDRALALLVCSGAGLVANSLKWWMKRQYIDACLWEGGAKQAVLQASKGLATSTIVDLGVDKLVHFAKPGQSAEDKRRVDDAVKFVRLARPLKSAAPQVKKDAAMIADLTKHAEFDFRDKEKRSTLDLTGRTMTGKPDKRFTKSIANTSDLMQRHATYKLASTALEHGVAQTSERIDSHTATVQSSAPTTTPSLLQTVPVGNTVKATTSKVAPAAPTIAVATTSTTTASPTPPPVVSSIPDVSLSTNAGTVFCPAAIKKSTTTALLPVPPSVPR